MSTPQELPYIPTRSRGQSRTFVAALGTMIVAAVLVIILALAGAKLTGTNHAASLQRPSSGYAQAMQDRIVRAQNAVLNPITGEMHGG
jgi:hypothetical protein